METLHIYDNLLQFALFQGMSKAELGQVVAHTKLGFHKYAPGDIIVQAHAACTQLHFLIEGSVSVTTLSANHTYGITEIASAPRLFSPATLFGIAPSYASTYRAHIASSLIIISKEEIYRLLAQFAILRLNYINLLSAHIQKHHKWLWRSAPSSLEQRIVHFVASRCLFPAGPKQVTIKMTQLAHELGCSRLAVSQALNHLQAAGHITLGRGGFRIDALETLPM